MTEEKEKESSFMQRLNSILLIIAVLFSGFIITKLNTIEDLQRSQGLDIVRLDTNQKNVMSDVKAIGDNQLKWADEIKKWVEENYIRKAQK